MHPHSFYDVLPDDFTEPNNDDPVSTVANIELGKGILTTEWRLKETDNHLYRVSEYCRILALKSGLGLAEATLIKEAAPFHDIGEAGVSEAILSKPGQLNIDEWKIMKTHTQLGYEMLRDSKKPAVEIGAIIALTHHEKWDGSGYPHGLSRSDIPHYGRITALADVFDTLSCDRPYKKSSSLDAICSFIRSERCKHFDPQLVDVFFENIDAFIAIRRDFAD